MTFTFKPGIKVCPICGTQEVKEAVLIGIRGTEEGSNQQATQVHISCITSFVEIYPWVDGRTILVGRESLKHFNREEYLIEDEPLEGDYPPDLEYPQ